MGHDFSTHECIDTPGFKQWDLLRVPEFCVGLVLDHSTLAIDSGFKEAVQRISGSLTALVNLDDCRRCVLVSPTLRKLRFDFLRGVHAIGVNATKAQWTLNRYL